MIRRDMPTVVKAARLLQVENGNYVVRIIELENALREIARISYSSMIQPDTDDEYAGINAIARNILANSESAIDHMEISYV